MACLQAARAQQCDSACCTGGMQACCVKAVDIPEVVVNCHEADNALASYYAQNKLPTTEEILSRIAGVSLIRRGDYGSEPALRCYCGGQINTTLNGMKIFGACTDKMDPVTIYMEPSNLSTVNVEQGAAGSKYGSTIGGSMNMNMKEAELSPQRDLYFTTASSYSSVNNGYNGSASLLSTGPKASFRIGLVYRKAQDYKEGGGEVVPYSQYEKGNLSASASFKVAPRQKVVLDYVGDMGWNIGFPALAMDTRRARANIASASWINDPAGKVLKHIETKAYFNNIYHLMGNWMRSDAPMLMNMPGMSSTGGVYTDMTLAAGKNNQVELRGDYYANYTRASMTMYPENAPEMFMLTLPDNLRQFAGAFVNDEWQVAQNHILRFNMRNDYMHTNLLTNQGKQEWGVFNDTLTTTNKWLPSGSVEYSWLSAKHVSLNLTAAYGSSAPTGNQLYGYYLFTALDNYDYIGNPALKSEKALQGDVNLAYSDKYVNLSVTGYYHRLYDYIIGTVIDGVSPVTYGAAGVKQYINMPGAFITGADASLGFSLKQGIEGMNTFNYSYGSLSNGAPVPMLSPFRGINSLRYVFKGWHIQAETDWAMAKNRVNSDVGEITSPAYALLNLRTGYRFNFRNHVWAVNFSVENVLDTQYREYSDWGTVLRPGRSYVVYVSYSFEKSLKKAVN